MMKIRHLLTKALALCALLVLSGLMAAAWADEWDGTTTIEPQTNDDGAYVVTTPAELAWVADASNKGEAYTHDIVLANDIDLAGHPWKPICHNGTTTNKAFFGGSIDGQGHTIRGLNIVAGADDVNVGFIGAMGGSDAKKAVVKNLTLEGTVTVSQCSNADVGSLIGLANDLQAIENCHSKVDIVYTASSAKANYMGGLVGRMKATNITACSYSGTISLSADATMSNGWGGLVGSINSSTNNAEATIDGCTFEGTIASEATATLKYGAALVGFANLSKGTTNLTNNLVKGSMSVVVKPTNYGVFYGKRGGTVTDTDNYTEHFMMDGVELNTKPAPDPEPDPKPDPEPDPEPVVGDTVRVLCIGNSFTVDAVEDYLSPILRSVGKKVVLGYPYKGGTTLEMHMGYINGKNTIYNYRKIDADGKHTERAGSTFDVALQDERWDYVVVQTDHNFSGVYSHYFPWLTDIMQYVRTNGQNHNPRFFLYMTWAYDATSSYKDFPLYGNDQMTMYNAIIDCAYRAADEAGIGTIVPAGTAVQNARTTYLGQNLNRDGYHMNYEYGRYLVGLAYAATVLGVDPQTVTYHPEAISDNLAQLCKDAVTAALAQPKQITSLADKWSVNPDVKNQPLPRQINISLQTDREDELMGSKWNFIDATDPMAVVDNLIDTAYVATPVRASVNKAFTSDEPGSLLLTGLFHGQTYDIALHYVLNGQPATIVQRAIMPDVNGRVYIDAETASERGDAIDGLYQIVITPSLTYTDAEGATATISPSEGMPQRVVPGTPWDGTTLSEPAMGAGHCYVINAGAELAWVANLSNQGITAANMLITQDIDLGGHKWTPIGRDKYYNGSIKGQGHTIRGLLLQPAAADVNCGLVGQTNSASTISDLTLEGRMEIAQLPTGKNADYGSFVGLANSLKALTNCHSMVDIEGACGMYQGGLIGRMKATRVDGCSYQGNMTISSTDSKTKGYAALVGTANSGVEGAKGSVTNCFFTGTLNNTSATATTYGAAIMGYANLSKGTLTINNCYVAGSLQCQGTRPANYGVVVGKATGEGSHTLLGTNYGVDTLPADEWLATVSADEVHSGHLCYLLNAGKEKMVFGQNLAEEMSFPTILKTGEEVFRTQFMAEGSLFGTTYSNAALRLPADEPTLDGMQFDGWFDAETEGQKVEDGAPVAADATLYAHFSVPSGIGSATLDTQGNLPCYTLGGVKAGASYKGIVVFKGKKVKR